MTQQECSRLFEWAPVFDGVSYHVIHLDPEDCRKAMIGHDCGAGFIHHDHRLGKGLEYRYQSAVAVLQNADRGLKEPFAISKVFDSAGYGVDESVELLQKRAKLRTRLRKS